MTRTSTADAATASALREIRDRYAPEFPNRGPGYKPPSPHVAIPDHLIPKGAKSKRLTDAHAAYLAALDLLDKADDALDAAESDYRERDAYRARRDEIADLLARGEVGPEAVEAIAPAYTDAEMLARCETFAVAVGKARKRVADVVAEYDAAVLEIAPSVIPAAVEEARRLDTEATESEARAAAARARANAAAQVPLDLRLPEAVAALRAVGDIGRRGGYDIYDRARLLRGYSLVGPVEGWSTDRADYRDPRLMQALGVSQQTDSRISLDEFLAESRRAAARGEALPIPDHLRDVVATMTHRMSHGGAR
jgi:hypothetical protein